MPDDRGTHQMTGGTVTEKNRAPDLVRKGAP